MKLQKWSAGAKVSGAEWAPTVFCRDLRKRHVNRLSFFWMRRSILRVGPQFWARMGFPAGLEKLVFLNAEVVIADVLWGLPGGNSLQR